jgi:PTS system nitrogen regulatory IIA component
MRAMGLADLLHPRRVHVVPAGAAALTKPACLEVLADVVAATTSLDRGEVLRVLREREDLQSTGLGESVAIPHGALADLDHQVAAMILSTPPIDFAAIDGRPVHIIVAVLSPKKAAGEHLKTLARISRILRTQTFRARLLDVASGEAAVRLIADEEGAVKP